MGFPPVFDKIHRYRSSICWNILVLSVTCGRIKGLLIKFAAIQYIVILRIDKRKILC